jgi:hypothetical protein
MRILLKAMSSTRISPKLSLVFTRRSYQVANLAGLSRKSSNFIYIVSNIVIMAIQSSEILSLISVKIKLLFPYLISNHNRIINTKHSLSTMTRKDILFKAYQVAKSSKRLNSHTTIQDDLKEAYHPQITSLKRCQLDQKLGWFSSVKSIY